MATKKLGSKWGSLSDRLLADIYPVGRDGLAQLDASSNITHVVAPPTDANIELVGNWLSPFEGGGLGSKFPTLMAYLQSGALEAFATANVVTSALGIGDADGKLDSLLKSGVDKLQSFSQSAAGRSSMTKLNSTQVFTGSPPVKIPLTLHFRAFDNPQDEVEKPIAQLAEWMLAQKLSETSAIVAAADNSTSGKGIVAAFMPSLAPQMVALSFGGYLFSPMVIESMAHPITGPRGSSGAMLHVSVAITFSTVTALDAEDWRRARTAQPTKLFNNI